MPKSTFDDTSTLIQVMSWCRQAKQLLPEPMLTQIYDHRQTSVIVWNNFMSKFIYSRLIQKRWRSIARWSGFTKRFENNG